ncbi:hypothetical protein CGCTS75_v010938 [Colletotrichum tropicale]|nr:hypothetical protein CGCTS75_v010938 [Colletotrichum tropicale]
MFLLSYLVFASLLLRPLLIRNAGRTQFSRYLLQHDTQMDSYEISMIAHIVLLEETYFNHAQMPASLHPVKTV